MELSKVNYVTSELSRSLAFGPTSYVWLLILWTSNKRRLPLAIDVWICCVLVARVSFCASQASPCYLAYARRGWSEVTLTATYPSPSLTGRTFPNPGWHLPTNIRITPQIFPLPYYGGGHASVNCRTWTAFRYIAAVFWAAEGDGWDRWWQKSANLTKLERQPDLLAQSNHSLHLRNCATFPFEFWHYPDLWFWNGIFGTYINWETLSFCSNSPHVNWIFW